MRPVGFIGFGRMGSALVKGGVTSGALKKSDVIVCDPEQGARRAAQSLQLRRAASVSELVAACDMVFLCVKPQGMDAVLDEVKKIVALKKHQKKCFVSIAAGIPLVRLRKKLGNTVSLFRVMPNTPALLGAGISGMSKGPNATPTQEKKVRDILTGVGEVVSVPESFMDAVTALSGSGPAYVFYLAEVLIKGAASLGLGPELARKLVHQTVYGAGLMLKTQNTPAEELRRQVTSPGGTTAAAIAELEKRNFLKIVESAVEKAAQRSAELAKI